MAKLLAPFAGGVVEAREAARSQHWLEERVYQEEAKSRISTLQDRLLTRTALDEALDDFTSLTKEHWPVIPTDYLTWLQEVMSTRLTALDLARSIVWDGNVVTYPGELPTIVELITFYELVVTDPLPMVHALILGLEDLIARYFGRVTPSIETWRSILDFVHNPASPSALEHMLRFLGEMSSLPGDIRDALVQMAAVNPDGRYTQVMSFKLVAKEQSNTWLEERVDQAENVSIRYSAEAELIRRQHEPTLMAKLDAAIKNPSSLGDYNYFPDRDKPEWLSQIKSPFAWEKVRVLRERGLQLELHGVVAQCTSVLIAIDRPRAIATFKQQLNRAPASWKIRQRILILEQEQLLTIDNARLGPFERVLTRLRYNTSSTRVMVWCEGINDEEVFRTLLVKMSDAPIDIMVGNVHGWPGTAAGG